LRALGNTDATVVFGPRTGSKTEMFSIADNLPPGPVQKFIPVRVTQVESIGPIRKMSLTGIEGSVVGWREWIDTTLAPVARYFDGGAAIVRDGNYWYVGCRGDSDFTQALIGRVINASGLTSAVLPAHIRMRRRGDLCFAFNYGSTSWAMSGAAKKFILGTAVIGPHDLACWR
jgi:beta-galactosidase